MSNNKDDDDDVKLILAKDSETRIKIVNEILSTEQTYVKQLEQVIDLYIRPLKILSQNDEILVLTMKQIRTLFSNLEMIYELQVNFLNDLTNIINTPYHPNTNKDISQIFITFAPYFKLYTSYVSNHDYASNFLAKLIKNDLNGKIFNKKCYKINNNKLI